LIIARHLCWILLLVAPQVTAAWLGICTSLPEQAGVRTLDRILKPTGVTSIVVAAETRLPDCTMKELPLGMEQLRWAKIVSRSDAEALSRGAILKSAIGETQLAVPREIIPLHEGDPPPASLPLATELITQLSAAAFGTANRAAINQDASGILLDCAGGNTPAGALLRSRAGALPAGASIALKLDADANGSFRFGTADAAREQLGEALVLGTINPGTSSTLFSLPADLHATTWQFWVINCPAASAKLTIRSIRLQSQQSGPVPRRALWFWEPSAWQKNPGALFKLLAENAANTVFVTIPLTSGNSRIAESAVLERFVAEASKAGVSVWAVVGDPLAVLPEGRRQYVAMARAYAAYNRDAPSAARLAGMQLDIEPYLNRGYHIDTEAWLSAYLETLSQVRAQATMPIDVAVPFWWGRQRYRDGMFLDHLRPLVEVVTVMNYRTDRQQLVDFAEPFLAWGVRSRRSIRIGLEAGPIPDESQHIFRSSAQGDLWLVPLEENALILSINVPQANPAGGAYSYSHTLDRTGNSTTFHRNVNVMRTLLPELENIWSAWPSFGGIALHGLDAD
jgi:hypothetical protein